MDENKKSINIKKIILITLIAIVIIGVIIFAIIIITNPSETGKGKSVTSTLTLTGSEYDNIVTKNMELFYDGESDQTTITLVIENTSDTKIENADVDVILLNESEQQLAGVRIKIESLEANSEMTETIEISGDGSEIKKVQLNNPGETEEQTEE